MRHNKSGRKLGRTWEHRKALFRNMAKSLLTHGRIRTTESKAKELRKVAEKLVTLALRNDLHSRRQAFKVLGDHSLVNKLFDEVGPRFAGVSGGYTRIVKMGLPRRGDCAPMAFIEFTRQSGESAPDSRARQAKPEAAPAPEAPKGEVAAEPTAQAPAQAEGQAAVETAPEAPAAEAAVEEPAAEAAAEEPAAEETQAPADDEATEPDAKKE